MMVLDLVLAMNVLPLEQLIAQVGWFDPVILIVMVMQKLITWFFLVQTV